MMKGSKEEERDTCLFPLGDVDPILGFRYPVTMINRKPGGKR
jgi:hypothetical protein